MTSLGILLIATLWTPDSTVSDANQGKVMVIAHRGASAYAPENTIAALQLAMQQKADALEIDVRQTSDGHIVLMHDATVNRTTNGRGTVRELTLAEIKSLDAGEWFDARFRGERVPLLEEVMHILDDRTTLIIEVKGGARRYPGIEERVVDVIRQSGRGDRVILKSFDRDVVSTFAGLAPDTPRLFVYTARLPWLGIYVDDGVSRGDVLSVDAHYIQPHWLFLSAAFTRKAQEVGFKVVAWGVNAEHQIRKAVASGVDGIETDFPDVARRIVTGQ